MKKWFLYIFKLKVLVPWFSISFCFTSMWHVTILTSNFVNINTFHTMLVSVTGKKIWPSERRLYPLRSCISHERKKTYYIRSSFYLASYIVLHLTNRNIDSDTNIIDFIYRFRISCFEVIRRCNEYNTRINYA